MTDDIVTRLREKSYNGCKCIECEAADEIQRLRALIKEYVEASTAEWTDTWVDSFVDIDARADSAFEALQREARRG